jgi:hypothetical protein
VLAACVTEARRIASNIAKLPELLDGARPNALGKLRRSREAQSMK